MSKAVQPTQISEERLYQVLLEPMISEKASRIADRHGQISFKVATSATKSEIKAAVEKMFSVDVNSVQVANVRGKAKRTGRINGMRKSWKKAFVRLAEGQDIDFHGT